MFGATCYAYYRLKKIFYLISIVMDSEILDQLTNSGRDVDFEFPKPKRGRKKKADTKMNELEDNDVRDKRRRLVACVLSGNSKMYLGKEYTEQPIYEMDCDNVNTLLNRYKSILSAQMTKSLGKSVINLYSNVACSVLGVGNQQELSTDLESDPFLNLLLLLTMFGSTSYVYYRLKKISYLISIVMDSEILDQLTNLGRDVDSEFPKPKRGRKKKADTKMNELEDNDVRDKRERLVACVLSGNSKMYLGKEYTEEQINKMDCNDVNTLLNRYESVLSAQMTKSLGKSL